jgi:hypothetical protein
MVDMAGPSWKVKPVALQAKRGKPKEVNWGNFLSGYAGCAVKSAPVDAALLPVM